MMERKALEEVALAIKERLKLESSEQFMEATGIEKSDYKPLTVEEFDGLTFAVDGSNLSICDWSIAQANLIRAGYVVYRGKAWQRTKTTFDRIFLADRRSYRDQFLPYMKAFFGLDTLALKETELDRLTTYFREMQEYIALSLALDEARKGDLLLYDGGLSQWKERPFGGALDAIFSKAEERGVSLLGISKSSTLSWGEEISRPFIQHAAILGERLLPEKAWYLEVGEKRIDPRPGGAVRSYVARFHPRASRAFRVDAPSGDGIDLALSHAAGYSGSAESLGYPHALFRAHHEMRIGRDEGALLRLFLMEELGRSGLELDEAEVSLDYHEILDSCL
ncbi:MAG: DNA double-strand break repair nuclease NurA [Methanotrichaceae archaeon]|nr:DNA double-strand break repair nuclease NurA [Methanotrichaceae archaeon]